MMDRKPKLALLVNIIAPARLPVYAALAEHFDLLILHGGVERNRDSWRGLEKCLPKARVVRAWGWQLPFARRKKGRSFDRRYIHVTPGYVWHLLAFRPEAVITGEMGLRTLIALAYGSLFRRPVWLWWGGTLHTERGIGPGRRTIRAVVGRWARWWLSYGSASTEYLRSLNVATNRIVQIQNSVDERLFAPDLPAAFEIHPRPVLLYVGQFIMRKGVELLLGAASALQKEGLSFSLMLVGSGPDKRALVNMVRQLDLKNVNFLCSQSPEQMPSVYRSADILVFPTLEDVWGLVANEAILSGLTVLCSKYAGCAAELLSPQSIFDPLKADEFKAKLREAIRGQLAEPDCSRLRTTSQIVNQIIGAIDASMSAPNAAPSCASRPNLRES